MAVMTAEQAAEYGKTLSFEQVWAALMEDRKQRGENERRLAELHEKTEKAEQELAEQRKELDRELAEQRKKLDRELAEQRKELAQELAELHKETERAIKEADEQRRETDRRIAQVTKAVGEVHNSVGELVETLISARIWEKFENYHMERVYQRVPIYDGGSRCVAEVDALLSNTTHAIAVEVKRRLKKGNVDFHLKRLELVREYPPAEIKLDRKTLMGAVAGGTVPPEVRDYAHENGLFVIELSGEAARLAPPPAGFRPREWA